MGMLIYTLKVDSVIKETIDTTTICFKQPGLKKVRYKPGQYLTLIFRINGRRYIRPYSFSSAPGIDPTLNITVKRVPGGVVSNHILDRVSVGDMIEVLEPMGDFILDRFADNVSKKYVVLWGSGSGITPLMSIAKFALNSSKYEHVTLVYGNRTFETTIFSEQIKQLQQLHKERFSVWHFYTQAVIDDSNPYIIKGRIEATKVLNIMQAESDFKNANHYICGPVGLKDSVKHELAKLGIASENILAEDFEVTRDPKAFEEIFTQNVILKTGDKELEIEVAKGKSILEAGIDAMIDLSYSCQTGNCLLCKAVLLNGKVKTIGVENLPDDLQSNECLLCCSFPLTANVKLLVKN
ncbi:FAD-binding oxidoreductase [Mucilaginibacter sp.]